MYNYRLLMGTMSTSKAYGLALNPWNESVKDFLRTQGGQLQDELEGQRCFCLKKGRQIGCAHMSFSVNAVDAVKFALSIF